MSDLARWAKVEIVNGVMGMVYHTYDSDQDQYTIHCVIQDDVGEVDVKVSREKPWTQQEFDAMDAAGMIASCIGAAREIGFEPVIGDAA